MATDLFSTTSISTTSTTSSSNGLTTTGSSLLVNPTLTASDFDISGFGDRSSSFTSSLTSNGTGGQKTFVINRGELATITNFGGVGRGNQPTAATIAEADTLKFNGQGLTPENLLLNQNGADLVITFEGVSNTQVTLKDFRLENFDNLSQATGANVNLGNILFSQQTEFQDSFDVFNGDLPRDVIFRPNTVTFLDAVSQIVRGLDDSNDIINATIGDHTVFAGSGNDILRGGSGSNILYGGGGDNVLEGGFGTTTMFGGSGNNKFVIRSTDGLDMIQDFKLGRDRIVLADGLTYDQLTVTQDQAASSASIFLKSTGKLLAVVNNLGTSSLNASAFESQVRPKVVVISLDGATPRLVNQYLDNGALSQTEGLGLLKNVGISALQNITVTPSLTAPGHIAIATGSSAANNNINANSFHLVASPFSSNISGFGAPIGGYSFANHPEDGHDPTAEPLWIAAREAGKTVIAATFPGADGINVTIPGVPNSRILQPASDRTVDYTVPFGEFGGVSAKGFALTSNDFSAAPGAIASQISAAGKVSYSPILQKTTALDSFTAGGVSYSIQVAALDTTDDGKVDYDTLVFFDAAQGIQSGPFNLPSTGPAYVKASDQKSSLFYLEGSSNKAGTSFYVSNLAPDLSTVRIARYAANDIPRNAAVLANVDDINTNVGFWAAQADFRIPERLSPGFDTFPDLELEKIYTDQVKSFVDYQTRVALRALNQYPTADVGLFYIEQPDGSGHQFLLTDPRQATNPLDPTTIGAGQDQAKIARYQNYLQFAYQTASNAVQRIIQTVGTDSNGIPNSDIIVVSDHGFEPFFTTVSINNLLKNSGIPDLADTTKVRAINSGPAVNIYINLQGREPNGTVTPEQYIVLQKQIAEVLKAAADSNPNYTAGQTSMSLFDKIYSRPAKLGDANFGLETGEFIGQDTGDVFALLTPGYNFDGIQGTGVIRLGDAPSTAPILSVPNFYGAHGYDPTLPNLSAIFYAAGPSFGQGTLPQVQNIDIAPTVLNLIGVQPAATVQGSAIATLLTANSQ